MYTKIKICVAFALLTCIIYGCPRVINLFHQAEFSLSGDFFFLYKNELMKSSWLIPVAFSAFKKFSRDDIFHKLSFNTSAT